MTYKETLDWLYTQLPMFQRVGAQAMKKDLTNIKKLCAALGTPQDRFPTVHIAGTNGKGSTAHLLAAVLQAHGFKTGLYTSPHYKDFRERIKIDGALISKKSVIDFTAENRALFEEIKPSFFEITVALAFDYFARQKVDIAVIETGLGGRLDSTNIIKPLLAVITNISYDHQQFLGDTLELIAGEKAGIIKENTPVVIGETQEETRPVFLKKAEEESAAIYFADQEFKAEYNHPFQGASPESFTHRSVLADFDVLNLKSSKSTTYAVNLIGAYQAKNLQTVLKSIEILAQQWAPLKIEEDKLQTAFSDLKQLTNFIGRWHLLGQNPLILADSAHNEGGIRLAMQQIEGINYTKLHFVIGMVNDKEVEKVLRMLPKEAKYYFAKADIPRGLDAEVLREKAVALGLKGGKYSSVRNALKAAKRAAGVEDLIYVGGSTFVVAEVV